MFRPLLVFAALAALPAVATAQRYAASEAFVSGAEIGCAGVPPSAGLGMSEVDRPAYPPASVRAEEEGKARVAVCISPEGKALSVKLLQPPIRPEVINRKYADPVPAPVEFTEFPRLRAAMAPYACNKTYRPVTNAAGKPVASCNVVIEHTWRLADYPLPPPPAVVDVPVQVEDRAR